MPEYDMPIDEQIKQLARKFDTFETRLDSIDTKLTTVEATLTTNGAEVKTMKGLLESTHALASRTHLLLEDTHSIANRTQALLEDTHAVAKLGLEGVQGLRESTDEKFAAAAKTNAEQTDLLKSLIVHVRKRVERVERPKRRRP